MNEIARLVPTKPDAELAAEFKKRAVEACCGRRGERGMKVWVRRYRIEYDMCDAIQAEQEFLSSLKRTVEVISEDEAERLNRAFKAEWPEVQ